MNNAHKHIDPPRSAETFLGWFLKGELLEEILGDLYEYHEELLGKPSWKRKLFYWFHVVHFLRPFALKKPNSKNSNTIDMFKHNFKIAWRSLSKQKMYSSIKIGGFSLGIASCLLIALFIMDELSYDQHYATGDQIYRLVGASSRPEDNNQKWPSFPAPIGEVLSHDFPEIEKVGRLIPYDWFDAGNNQFRPINKLQNSYEEGFVYADQDLLEVLEIPMVYGDPLYALSEPNSLVISKRKADKYFPNEDPVGQVVILNEDESNPYVIGGVMQDFPQNTHFRSEFLLTLTGKEFWEGEQTNWCCWNYDSYIRVSKGTDINALEQKLLSIRDEHIFGYAVDQGEADAEDIKKYMSLELQSVSNIYLAGGEVNDIFHHGDRRVVWLFGIIAGFILLLACINFINLSTAKSANRAKEVGLRKVVGSYRSNLVSQFMTESLLFSLVSFVIGLLLAWFLLPYFNWLSDKSLVFPWTAWWLVPSLVLSIGVTGLLSGVYPSLYLSAFKPIQVLNGTLSRGSKSSKMRGVMVVFQFAISIILIICTFITYQQMGFILNTKIGFDKEQVVMIQGANTLGDKREAFKNELLNLSEVKSTSVSNYLPVSGTKRDFNQFWKDGRNKIDKSVSVQIWRVDPDYINTLGMNLLEGRNFSTDMVSDSSALIINQTMAKKLGLDNPIGEKVMNWRTWNVIGVVEDFHFESMKGEIQGLCFALGGDGSIVSIKLNTEDLAGSLANISNVWEEFMPNQPIRYSFLDERYEHMYDDVKRTGNVFTVFAVLAIIVACLGLFALSAFMVEQRGKEISIRKVLGASLVSIFNLLTIDFLKLVLIALLIAIPIGWYMMSKWLEDYIYRITISWEAFAIAGVLAVAIALLTISSESIRAGLVNPAKKLRSE